MYKCGLELLKQGAVSVFAFATHGVFPKFSKKKNGNRAIFEKFRVTNSIPTSVKDLPNDNAFEVVDLLPQILANLDTY